MLKKLKIDVNASEASASDGVISADGLHLGTLRVSSSGMTSETCGSSYDLSMGDLAVVPAERGGVLGCGSSGMVRLARHVRTGQPVALKEIKMTSREHLSEIRRELEALHGAYGTGSGEEVRCPFLVDFYGAFWNEDRVCIAMEYMDGSLDDVRKPLEPRVLAAVTRSMLQCVVYLHRTRHLMHRDIKPSNVLFRLATGDIKITDFGISSSLESTKADAESFVGTLGYMSPERLEGKRYSYAADLWALGVVVAELALGESPFSSLRFDSNGRYWALLRHLQSDDPAFALPASLEPELGDFVMACVAKDPNARPRADELLTHPFLLKHCVPATGDTAETSAADREVVRRALAEPGALLRHARGDGEEAPAPDVTATAAAVAATTQSSLSGQNTTFNLDDELDRLLV